MNIGKFSCYFHMPPAIRDTGRPAALPPYALQKAYCVDDYDCPANWMHGSSNSASYFVEVKQDHGMWLDFNANHNLEYHTAIVVSIQGINPLTGLQTKSVNLEKYDKKCPKHDLKFSKSHEARGEQRFCTECGFQWPSGNFISTSSTPIGLLWIDGFRTEDGVVRQYVFSDDVSKGVAAQIIGDDRVYAIGVAFYKSIHRKPSPTIFNHNIKTPTIYPTFPFGHHYYDQATWGGQGGQHIADDQAAWGEQTNAPMYGMNSMNSCSESRSMLRSFSSDKVEIAAGAQISQKLYEDNDPITMWEKEPSGFIYINYVPSSVFQQLITTSKRENEGFVTRLKLAT